MHNSRTQLTLNNNMIILLLFKTNLHTSSLLLLFDLSIYYLYMNVRIRHLTVHHKLMKMYLGIHVSKNTVKKHRKKLFFVSNMDVNVLNYKN